MSISPVTKQETNMFTPSSGETLTVLPPTFFLIRMFFWHFCPYRTADSEEADRNRGSNDKDAGKKTESNSFWLVASVYSLPWSVNIFKEWKLKNRNSRDILCFKRAKVMLEEVFSLTVSVLVLK